ncbi:unnamed protein product [Adineta steineri]|uniref:Uncharacterized protein n=1 Tax=Adineta steineri TaxID=433720 RepID=A0A819W575_9BILA|nr:unnamed protein product [Adineta steineri]CAF4120386.1 unnamed protein product [Adineta steineri]
MTAQPMLNGLAEDIVNERIILNQDIRTRARYLVDNYNFYMIDARKIWCFQLNKISSNILIDCTIGV